MLPTYINLFSYQVYTFGVFILLGLILSAFVIWKEGRKDGFDEERLFDLFIISVVFGIFFARAVYAITAALPTFNAFVMHIIKFWTPGLHYLAGAVGIFLSIFLFTKLWKWSLYRVLDIFSLAVSFGMSIVMLGFVGLQQNYTFLFAFAFWLLVYAILTYLRDKKLSSGLIFSTVAVSGTAFSFIFFNVQSHLIFYVLLVTLSLLIFYFRNRKSAVKNPIPQNIQNLFKMRLKNKGKRLEEEQQLLNVEDPYLQSDRAIDNAEFEDDASEDIEKTITDTKQSSISKMQIQIKRALGKMKLGTYGICEICGKPIDKARLEVYPEATTCMTCANKSS